MDLNLCGNSSGEHSNTYERIAPPVFVAIVVDANGKFIGGERRFKMCIDHLSRNNINLFWPADNQLTFKDWHLFYK